MDFKRVTTPVGWFDIWLFEPRYGPTTIDCPYLMVRKLNPPIAVTWTIAQCEEDPDKYVADFVNALSGRRITCVILLASKGYTVFKTLRYLTFSRLKQCSPFQKYVSGMPGVDEDDIMINTDVQGVVTVEWYPTMVAQQKTVVYKRILQDTTYGNECHKIRKHIDLQKYSKGVVSIYKPVDATNAC